MNIALVAHDKKKELMVDFCIAYKFILQKHNLYATGTTGTIIAEETGLNVYKFFPGPLGGAQQIEGRVACNEIDMVIFFRDPSTSQEYEPDVNPILRLCDLNNIPIATNIATAEILIKGLERGDLGWRELVNR
ncbi:MAG: methylglyoxal synthase [Clostridiaceae bacterium]|nr:methylglyoxal synthase [Clostridiaceae bacterium]